MITKHQVMAKCIHIMDAQLKNTNHPVLRERIRDKIDYFSSPGRMDEYQMIVYSNCITLINNDYENRPNINLYEGNKLTIGRFDSTLNIHDKEHIRIHGNGSADSGACVHGEIEGDCISHKREFEKGKEVKYTYGKASSRSSIYSDNKRVNNNAGASFFNRLIHNETIGSGDYIKGLIVIVIVGAALSTIGLSFLSIVPGLFLIYIMYKRITDAGYEGATRLVFLVGAMLLNVIGIIILALLPSKVISEQESNYQAQMRSEANNRASNDLKKRCNSFSGTLSWFYTNNDIERMASSLAGKSPVAHKPYHPSTSDSQDEELRRQQEEEEERLRQEEEQEELRRQEEERERAEEADRERRRGELEREISALMGRLSSEECTLSNAESRASSLRQQGETYLSYANSEQDESRRNDYLQSAESRFSEAAQYESEAASAASAISSLQSEISSLQSEMNRI